MPEPQVIQAINAQRARLLAREAATMREMAQRWLGVEDALRADMLELSLYLDELRLKGETIGPARLLQMERYRSLIADARAQQEQYARWVADRTADDQRAAVAQGVTDAQVLIEAAGMDAHLDGFTFNRINVSAVEFMTGFAADGSPLYDLLRASYPKSVVELTDALIQGLAKGLGPRATAALMQKAMAGNLDRALLIARTEQLRALRAGSLEQMKQSKVVNGYIRRAQRNGTVCPACLALDGTKQETTDVFKSHPACRCFAQPVLRFGKTPSFPSGPEWLATQPESVQRSVLGPGKFELFKTGKLDWSQVAQVHNDPVWGPTIRQGKMADLKKRRVELSSSTLDYVGKTQDLRGYFPEGTPGREFITANDVELLPAQKIHIKEKHEEQVAWIESNYEIIQKAISSPDYISAAPFRDKGRWAVTHIVEVSDETYDLLIIGIRRAKNAAQRHNILTIFLSDKRFILDDDGKLREKWIKTK